MEFVIHNKRYVLVWLNFARRGPLGLKHNLFVQISAKALVFFKLKKIYNKLH